MEDGIRQKLLHLNRAFYEEHAAAFAATRYGRATGLAEDYTLVPGCV